MGVPDVTVTDSLFAEPTACVLHALFVEGLSFAGEVAIRDGLESGLVD